MTQPQGELHHHHHHRRKRPRVIAPAYASMQTGSRLLKLFAGLWALGSALPLLKALEWADQMFRGTSAGHASSVSQREFAIYTGLWLACLAASALLYMAALLGIAVRDIARNVYVMRAESRRRSRRSQSRGSIEVRQARA